MDIFLLALANIVDPATLLFMVVGVGAGLLRDPFPASQSLWRLCIDTALHLFDAARAGSSHNDFGFGWRAVGRFDVRHSDRHSRHAIFCCDHI